MMNPASFKLRRAGWDFSACLEVKGENVSRSIIGKDIVEDSFNMFGFPFRKFSEFALPGAIRQATFVLSEKAEKKIYGAIGHIHNARHTLAELIIPLQEFGFPRQILLYGLLHAGVKKFGMRRCVKETVKVGCFVEDIDVSVLGRLPLDHRQ
jgi:hypothetical protein